MKKVIALVASLVLAACAHSNDAASKIPEPEVLVEQTSSMPAAAQNIDGPIPVSLRITVTNHAGIPITLERAEVSTMGSGGWNIRPTTQNLGYVIPAGTTESKDFWVNAQTGLSLVGNNGPVSLRVKSTFKSAEGSFTNVSIQQVSGVVQ